MDVYLSFIVLRPRHVVSEKTQVDEAAKPRMRIPVVLHQTFLEEPVPGWEDQDLGNRHEK